jgi:hypothetical protein
MQKKDKEKVFGGEWTEAQLREFLTVESHDGTDPDYIAVIRAYRYMEAPTFAEYLALFKAEGHNLNAVNLEGISILGTIGSHTRSESYAEALKEAGAE